MRPKGKLRPKSWLACSSCGHCCKAFTRQSEREQLRHCVIQADGSADSRNSVHAQQRAGIVCTPHQVGLNLGRSRASPLWNIVTKLTARCEDQTRSVHRQNTAHQFVTTCASPIMHRGRSTAISNLTSPLSNAAGLTRPGQGPTRFGCYSSVGF